MRVSCTKNYQCIHFKATRLKIVVTIGRIFGGDEVIVAVTGEQVKGLFG